MEDNRYISFSLGDMHFEYDEAKNISNIEKHGISFKNAARVFFDYDRIFERVLYYGKCWLCIRRISKSFSI